MASELIGRTACPECGFAAAHVKKSEKCLYRYCPECGAQYHAKGTRQVDALMAKTRTEGGTVPKPAKPEPAPKPAPAKPAPAVPPAPPAPPAPAPKPAGFFSFGG